MIETGVVLVAAQPVYWHLPEGRTGGSLPDSRKLWEVLWDLRKEPGLGFAHSHPGSGVPRPSLTDVTTFNAIERGLGRDVGWFITSSDHLVLCYWTGPGKHDYYPQVIGEHRWAAQLREHSQGKGK
jgi:hypothetical protein